RLGLPRLLARAATVAQGWIERRLTPCGRWSSAHRDPATAPQGILTCAHGDTTPRRSSSTARVSEEPSETAAQGRHSRKRRYGKRGTRLERAVRDLAHRLSDSLLHRPE